ncbi:hypothetical protein CB1_000740005 [Camelus ferus]|nr:hypothetical protein CB1_000740005 [Camelus ferus]
MSALGAGHSAGGGCDEAAALGPVEALETEEGERPGALRQMWRYRSWDVPQIPAEASQAQTGPGLTQLLMLPVSVPNSDPPAPAMETFFRRRFQRKAPGPGEEAQSKEAD